MRLVSFICSMVGCASLSPKGMTDVASNTNGVLHRWTKKPGSVRLKRDGNANSTKRASKAQNRRGEGDEGFYMPVRGWEGALDRQTCGSRNLILCEYTCFCCTYDIRKLAASQPKCTQWAQYELDCAISGGKLPLLTYSWR